MAAANWVFGVCAALLAACAYNAAGTSPPATVAPPSPASARAPESLTIHPNLDDALASSFALVASRPPFTVQFTAEIPPSYLPPLQFAWDFEADGQIDATSADPVRRYDQPGEYRVSLQLTDGAGRSQMAGTRIVVVGAAAERPFIVGVTEHFDLWQGHLDSLSDLRQASALIRDAGVKFVRWDFPWSDLEPYAGVPDWAVHDAAVGIAREYDLETLGVLTYSPPWATGHEWSDPYRTWTYLPPDHLNDWGAFVYRAVDHYKSDVHQWAIWNEPNLSTFFAPADPAIYAALLREAYLAAKYADPQTFIVGGELAVPDDAANFVDRSGQPAKALAAADFLTGMYANGAAGFYDALSFHPYTDPALGTAALLGKVRSLRDIMRRSGDTDTPLWITEYGWATTTPGLSEEAQARWLSESLSALADSGQVSAVFWYNLRDKGRSPASWEDNLGLVRFDWSPKPAYNALTLLTGASP